MAVNRDVNGAEAANQPPAYEFGVYRLEPSTRRLLRSGAPVPLTPKAFDILLALVERHDRVVEKSELMRLVWADSFVEEANLSQTVFVLRKTLADGRDGGSYIETVPRHGYRFVASVRETIAKPAADARPKSVWHWRAKYAAASVGLVTGLLLLAATWMPLQEPAARRIESLVVLPFDDFSDENRPEPLADSMTDALITKLGQVGGLRVISRTSAITYTNTSKSVPQIARELNVDAVVEGTVRRSSGRVSLNLKLIHAPTDRTVWAETYEADAHDALELHNEIARAIVSRTSVTPTARESERLAETTRVSPQVYGAYLKGRYFWNRRSEPDMRQAIEHFEEALRHDDGYAPAYAGLADSYALYGSYGWPMPEGNPWSRAIAAAERALQLDPLLADGHTSRARIALNYELDWERTEKGYRRALELNPGYANAHHWYGYYLMLTGRVKEGEAEMRRALELDPLSPIINANIGMAFYFARQYETAIAHWQNALEMHRNYRLLHVYMAGAYVAKGKYHDAVAQLEKSSELSGAGSWEKALLAHTYGRMGRREDAQRLLSTVLAGSDPAAYPLALGYVGLGDTNEAFKWLQRAVDTRLGAFNEVNADPLFDTLRADARFVALLERMHFRRDEPLRSRN